MASKLGAVCFSSDLSSSLFPQISCVCDALNSAWKGPFDAIICDPPYGHRTSHLPQAQSSAPREDSTQFSTQILHETLRIASQSLKASGRIAFWWFQSEEDISDTNNSLHENIRQFIISESLPLQLIDIQLDDFQFGSTSGSESTDANQSRKRSIDSLTVSRQWQRCIVVLQKQDFSHGRSIFPSKFVNLFNNYKCLSAEHRLHPKQQQFLEASWRGSI